MTNYKTKEDVKDKKIAKENREFVYKKEKYCSAPHCQDPAQDG